MLLTAVLVVLAWWQFGAHDVPAGQPPLATLDPTTISALREDFNGAAGQVRIIVLLSPT
jgi:hypothetical protein